ncbi:MAG: alkaline phosphatase family protein [Proteobacteria bacterium]|nr:alkaline phosphatase family protein [Pseudomonadota bacterium]
MKILYSAIATIFFILTLLIDQAHAYIGPGAGFAFISSFFVIFLTFVLALFSILAWPLRFLYRSLRHRKDKTSNINRAVVLGLDGLSPEIIERMMDDGLLPNFSRLGKEGYYSPLRTTTPPISPVAWSSFQTGVNPGKHNVFDFLNRDPKTHLPLLSFSRIEKPGKSFKIGKYSFPLSRPRITLLRKSKPFWQILGERGIFSTVLRVPVTFPPEKFRGHLLSAMGAPDLKGTQGTFTYYTTRNDNGGDHTGGFQIKVEKKGGIIESYISGPENSFLKKPEEMKIPFSIKPIPGQKEARISIDGNSFNLKQGKYSDWIRFSFKVFPGVKVRGIGRFLVRQIEPEFDMYLTPLNIDPENPAMPVSHPFIYSVYLAKLLGSYATLGEAEDTWALNEQVIDENEFLQQCYLLYAERKKMFFQALQKTRKGVCVCVFDTPDRIQHMFFKPSANTQPATENNDTYTTAIKKLYLKMDELLGEVLKELKEKDILLILSDHGISSFKRCFNLNTWLYQNGYLFFKDHKTDDRDFFANVDWEKTSAYGLGMTGLYINQKGREYQGRVRPGEEKERLKKELQNKLADLRDEENGEIAILHVYDTEKIYSGPYQENGPDLIIGCNDGYRISWDSVIGKQAKKVFEDNTKNWRADHSVASDIVPGILFCNRKIEAENPAIIDLAPTILNLFGIKTPSYMDGKAMKIREQGSGNRGQGSGNREQGTGNREQGSGNRE